MLSEPPCRFGYNKTASLLVLDEKVLKMKLSKEELEKISTRLIDLATECMFMYDEAKVGSRLVGCYCDSSYAVIARLHSVLRRADKLLDDLHCVEATLDGLLIQHKVLDDEEMI